MWLVLWGSTGCKASDCVCVSSSEGFPVFSTGMGRLVLGFASGGFCDGVMGNGLVG